MPSKTQNNLAKVAKARRKDEQKVASQATKLIKSEIKEQQKGSKKKQNKGRVKAAQQFQKASDNIFGLPSVLWPLILLVCYQMIRNALEKDQQKRDLAQAKRFLYESRGFR